MRKAGVITIYINGVAAGNFSSAVTYTTSTQVGIGKDFAANSDFWLGNFLEWSIAPAVAFYDANFTPPTAPFPDSLAGGETGYLLQEDGSSHLVLEP